MNEPHYLDPVCTVLSPTPESCVLELLYSLWLQSRNEERLVRPEEIRVLVHRSRQGEDFPAASCPELYVDDPKGEPFHKVFDDTVDLILSLDVPLLECIQFTFVVERMPISLREQLVRHRDAALWLQSGRIRDQRVYADEKKYYIPVVDRAHPERVRLYEESYVQTQEMLKSMLDAGIRIEDARNILPYGQLHRGSVTLNYRALKRVIGKRTSFIAQNSMWGPTLASLSREIGRIEPKLVRLFEPPPLKNGKYIGDPHMLENIRRLYGTDPLPPDPIFMKYEAERIVRSQSPVEWGGPAFTVERFLHDRRVQYSSDPLYEYLEYASAYVPMWGESIFKEHAWRGQEIVDLFHARAGA